MPTDLDGRISQQVYDVSNWADRHPGGRVIYTYAGKDATDVFAGFHSPAAWAQLRPFYVGELQVRWCHPLHAESMFM